MKLATHLKQNIFDDEAVEREANRDGYGSGLKEAGEKNEKVVALSADLTGSTRTKEFAKAFPDRFVQCGIAEQNMASVASGMSAMGKIPFIASYAMFSPGRSWEQVRTTIAYNNANVKIIGAHAGVSVGPDGATHQAIEDMAIMRVMPNMKVLAPCDINEAHKAMLWAAESEGPVYIRLAREATPVVTTDDSPFEFGKAMKLAESEENGSPKVGLITTGILAFNTLRAAKQLEDKGFGVMVIHMGTIKPLDTDAIDNLIETCDVLATVEEHQRAGGLGGAVAEYVTNNKPIKVIRLGVDDQFGQSGDPEKLLGHHGLDESGIAKQILEECAK